MTILKDAAQETPEQALERGWIRIRSAPMECSRSRLSDSGGRARAFRLTGG